VSAPAFQFYPKQWLGDDRILEMDWDARAMHLHLMCVAWQQSPPGTLPADERRVRRLLGNPKDWARLGPQILSAWVQIGDRFAQRGLLREAEKQARKRQKNAQPDQAGSPALEDTDLISARAPGLPIACTKTTRLSRARASSSSSTAVTTPSESKDSSGATASNRPPCECASRQPFEGQELPEAVADDFLLTFVNCKSDAAKNRHRPTWLGMLRDMRAHEYLWSEIWTAFVQAHIDAKHAPLHEFKGIWGNLRAAAAQKRGPTSGGNGNARGNGHIPKTIDSSYVFEDQRR
jgi:hypothetical protein